MPAPQLRTTPGIQLRFSFTAATPEELTTLVTAWFKSLAPGPGDLYRVRGITGTSTQGGSSSGSGSKLLSLLKATTGEWSLHSKVGRWAQAVSKGAGAVSEDPLWNVTITAVVDDQAVTTGEIEVNSDSEVAFRVVTQQDLIEAGLTECANELIGKMFAPGFYETLVVGSVGSGWLVGIFAVEIPQ